MRLLARPARRCLLWTALILAVILVFTWRLITLRLDARAALIGSLAAGLFWMLLPLTLLHARCAMPDSWVRVRIYSSMLSTLLTMRA